MWGRFPFASEIDVNQLESIKTPCQWKSDILSHIHTHIFILIRDKRQEKPQKNNNRTNPIVQFILTGYSLTCQWMLLLVFAHYRFKRVDGEKKTKNKEQISNDDDFFIHFTGFYNMIIIILYMAFYWLKICFAINQHTHRHTSAYTYLGTWLFIFF